MSVFTAFINCITLHLMAVVKNILNPFCINKLIYYSFQSTFVRFVNDFIELLLKNFVKQNVELVIISLRVIFAKLFYI